MDQQMERGVKRSEYLAAAALGLNCLTLAFGAGVYVNTIQVQGRAIEELQAAQKASDKGLNDLRETVIRIDANVSFLADRAREDRDKMERRK